MTLRAERLVHLAIETTVALNKLEISTSIVVPRLQM